MKHAIVIGCHVSGLGVVRALGRMGVPVVAVSYESSDIAQHSRYVSEAVQAPHPTNERDAFVRFLLENAHHWPEAVLFDTDDHAAVAISQNKATLAKHYKIAAEDWDKMRLFIEKRETYRLAEKCGVPFPKSWRPCSIVELRRIKDALSFPCILKPVEGHLFKKAFNAKVFQANNFEECERKFALCLEAGVEVIVQEIIPGDDDAIYKMLTYVNSRGEMSNSFYYRKLRQHPPQFGVMRVGVSEPRNPEVELLSKRLLKAAGLQGLCNVEFKKDARDGKLKLIEVNVRANRTNLLATTCGANFPWMIYLDLAEKTEVTVKNYKAGVYWIEFYADLFNALLRRRRDQNAWRDYFTPYLANNKIFAVLAGDDMKPFLKETLALPHIFWRNARPVLVKLTARIRSFFAPRRNAEKTFPLDHTLTRKA